MPSTLLLDVTTWDLSVDGNANIAVAAEPLSLAQDAASAIMTWLGELYYDTTIGVAYLTQILGFNPTLTLIKTSFVNAALLVNGIGAAQCFISAITDRGISGQIQVQSVATGQTAAANFNTINPQGD